MRRFRGLFGRRNHQQNQNNNNQQTHEEEDEEPPKTVDEKHDKPKRKQVQNIDDLISFRLCGCGCAELKLRSKELLWFDGLHTFVDCGLFQEDISKAISVEGCPFNVIINVPQSMY